MKSIRLSTKWKITLGLALLAPGVQAQTFTYNTGDLVAAFRETGQSDLVVDLGPITTFENATSPIVFGGSGGSANRFDTTAQLLANFGNLNNLTFAVFGTQGSTGGVGTDPANTSYLTLAETTPGTQTTAPNGYSRIGAGNIASAITGIAGAGSSSSGALIYAPSASYPPSSSTALIIPTSGAASINSYTTKFTATGGLQSQVAAPGIENTTSASFSSGSSTIVSDLYTYKPNTANTPATFDGTFTLSSAGTLTFTPASVPEPGTLALFALGTLAMFGLRQRTLNRMA